MANSKSWNKGFRRENRNSADSGLSNAGFAKRRIIRRVGERGREWEAASAEKGGR